MRKPVHYITLHYKKKISWFCFYGFMVVVGGGVVVAYFLSVVSCSLLLSHRPILVCCLKWRDILSIYLSY